jgi:uncharacterized membrane protein
MIGDSAERWNFIAADRMGRAGSVMDWSTGAGCGDRKRAKKRAQRGESREETRKGGSGMEVFKQVVEVVAVVIDAAGVVAIAVGIGWAMGLYVVGGEYGREGHRQLRQRVGRGVVVGLELLIAADIVRTVAVEATLRSVYVLGLIVLIRTFLSMMLEIEMEGRLPWRKSQ